MCNGWITQTLDFGPAGHIGLLLFSTRNSGPIPALPNRGSVH